LLHWRTGRIAALFVGKHYLMAVERADIIDEFAEFHIAVRGVSTFMQHQPPPIGKLVAHLLRGCFITAERAIQFDMPSTAYHDITGRQRKRKAVLIGIPSVNVDRQLSVFYRGYA